MKRSLYATERPFDTSPLNRWRMLVIAAATLVLCSCQTIHRQPHQTTTVGQSSQPQELVEPMSLRGAVSRAAQGDDAAGTPNAAFDRLPAADQAARRVVPEVALVSHETPIESPAEQTAAPPLVAAVACCPTPPALPPSALGPAAWVAGAAHGWSPDEHLCNGGDRDAQVMVKQDWSVQGLQGGDTVVHYDTLDGQLEVQPSNNVCLYAPRFAAVRKVYSMAQHEQHLRGAGVALPVGPQESGDAQPATTVVQPVQAVRQLALAPAHAFRDTTRGDGLENWQAAAGAVGDLPPYADLLIIHSGQFDNSEKARLALRLEAAVVWTHEKAVQVVVDNEAAVEASGNLGLQSVYLYEMPPGKPRLRVVKIASREDAQPGDTVDFTIRFDNVGDQPIGNVTVIDNLVTRLEYVADSQSCSLQADFLVEPNDGESLTLRWEIDQPLKVAEGGVIRFQCRVR